MRLLPHMAFALQSGKTTGRKDLPLVSHKAISLQANPLPPLQPHKASIVLPDSSRSRSAVGKEKRENNLSAGL